MKVKTVEKACLICGKRFTGAYQALYCSDECCTAARREQRHERERRLVENNQSRFNELLKYVNENNLKPVFAKYKSISRKAA